MATGDHGLTAISVAKKCKILDANKPVYFGELVTNGDTKYVRWELMKHHENQSKNEQNEQLEADEEGANYKSQEANEPNLLQN